MVWHSGTNFVFFVLMDQKKIILEAFEKGYYPTLTLTLPKKRPGNIIAYEMDILGDIEPDDPVLTVELDEATTLRVLDVINKFL